MAEANTLGNVTGIDLEEGQLELARKNSSKRGLTNVKFERASVYELPYQDKQFDAVFSHALMEHMQNPVAIFKEMHRVLKPGGIVGVRSPDLSAFVVAPEEETLKKPLDIWLKYRQHRGGDPFVGSKLRALLREAGFAKTIGSSSSETWGILSTTQILASVMADDTTEPNITETALDLGWADQAQMDNAARAWETWGKHPDAFASVIWCEAVGWKE